MSDKTHAYEACCRAVAEAVPSEVAPVGACTWPETDCYVNGSPAPARDARWDGCGACGHYRTEHTSPEMTCGCEVLGVWNEWYVCPCAEFEEPPASPDPSASGTGVPRG
jgi:hypothetical protein